ncbi:thiamine pyrophosphate-dependent enzyme [Brackiella oedipodis]|uniref:thiamine pyrophosphate-dependent enzyme n=1 Tax=Brackiella oedipodis TaxID=124225 RepID=UPI00048C1A63|nr:thiamine pyrophosphate-dependent enzyme [Brackiella oedipodis]
MSQKKVSDIMVEVLEQAGVKNCYGIVGDTLNHFTDSLSKSSINWVHVRHEEVGAFAAGADAFMTEGITACAGSNGPGSLHFINGIYDCHRNRAPVVLICSQLSNAAIGYLDFPQHVDFKTIYKDCSVFCEEISAPEQARYVMTQACQAALTKRGVAVVIMPINVSEQTTDDEVAFTIHHPKPVIRPSDSELQAMADLLNQHKKITIYAGAGCQHAHDQVVALSQKLKAPVAHTSRAKDFIEYDNPNNMGMTGVFGCKSGFYAIGNSEVLLCLGCDFAWTQYYPDHGKIIQIDADATHLGRRHPIEIGAVGDIAPSIEALMPLLHGNDDDSFLNDCLDKRKSTLEARANEEKVGKDVIHPQYLVSLLNKYADDDAIMTADGGSPMVWSLRHFDVNGKRRTLVSLLHGTMANAMPHALGLSKAFPKRQIISLSGDGGIAMLLGDLLTLRQEDLNIKIVVLNNSSLNFVELEQKVEGLLDNYTDLKNPDFGKVAASLGMLGITQPTNDGLEEAVQKFLAHDGPALLDVHTNPTELVMPPDPTFQQVSSFSLYATKAMFNGRAKDVVELLKDNFLPNH